MTVNQLKLSGNKSEVILIRLTLFPKHNLLWSLLIFVRSTLSKDLESSWTILSPLMPTSVRSHVQPAFHLSNISATSTQLQLLSWVPEPLEHITNSPLSARLFDTVQIVLSFFNDLQSCYSWILKFCVVRWPWVLWKVTTNKIDCCYYYYY